MYKHIFSITIILFIIQGCAKNNSPAPLIPSYGYKEDLREYEDSKLKEKNSASLFSKNKGDKLFVGYRSKAVGDVVVVKILESSKANNSSTTSTSKNTTYDSSISSLFGLPLDMGINDLAGQGTKLEPKLAATTNNKFNGSGNKAKTDTISATLAVRIVEILSNGNVIIEGKREILVDQQKQIITLRGIVREKDIAPDNTINSTDIADAQISYNGSGVITDANNKGWLAILIDLIWPF